MRNICFVGNLILITTSECELYHDDVTVTSFINITFGDAATKFVPNEQPAIIFCEQMSFMQIRFVPVSVQ